MKSVDFVQNLGEIANFQNFRFEQVRFPDPKSRSDCFPHLRIEVSFAPESLDIVLDTYKVHFGWLEAAVKLKANIVLNVLLYRFRPAKTIFENIENVHVRCHFFTIFKTVKNRFFNDIR